MRESAFGELAIARAMVLLKSDGLKIELLPIVHHPDEAGLIGAVQLMPAWMLEGHDSLIAVDIGGTNIRAGVVETRRKDKADLSKARVWKSELWRHADDEPNRTTTVEHIVSVLERLVAKAQKAGLMPAPVIGIACLGTIMPDGSIANGGQNLPGGNWESKNFNLRRLSLKPFRKSATIPPLSSCTMMRWCRGSHKFRSCGTLSVGGRDHRYRPRKRPFYQQGVTR